MNVNVENTKLPVVTDSTITRLRPRHFEESATLVLTPEVPLMEIHVNRQHRVRGYSVPVRAHRAVLKNGTPVGIWRFMIHNYPYTLDRAELLRAGHLPADLDRPTAGGEG